MQPDPTMIMLDQLVRVTVLELIKAVVWAPALYLAVRMGMAKKGR
jgi:hypothetical protein